MLGSVVLEHSPNIGQQRDERQVAEHQSYSDEALDDHDIRVADDLDLIVEGTARRVTDEKTLKRLARRYNAQGWPARAERGAFTADFSAPSAGRPPWHLYEVMPSTAFGVSTGKPFGATRWQFTKVAKRG